MIVTFNSLQSDNASLGIKSVVRVGRPLSPGHKATILNITGRAGSLFLRKDRDPLVLPVRFVFSGTTYQDKRAKARAIAAWLDTDDVTPLIFSDEPGVQYQAVCFDSIDTEETALLGFVDVDFFVPSSYAEATTARTTTRTATNNGTAECPCIITVTIQEGGTYYIDDTFPAVFLDGDYTKGIKLTYGDKYMLLLTELVAGDEVVINMQARTVTINGDDARRYVSFGSEYFKLQPGAFEIVPEPSDGLTISVDFRELYK